MTTTGRLRSGVEPADLRTIGEFGVTRRIDIAHHGIATHPPG